jgi:hypothetical protein
MHDAETGARFLSHAAQYATEEGDAVVGSNQTDQTAMCSATESLLALTSAVPPYRRGAKGPRCFRTTAGSPAIQ